MAYREVSRELKNARTESLTVYNKERLMIGKRRVLGWVIVVLLAAVAGGFWAEWRFLRGRTQCPHCGAYGAYRTTVVNGDQRLTCHRCDREFIAEVADGRFTSKNQNR